MQISEALSFFPPLAGGGPQVTQVTGGSDDMALLNTIHSLNKTKRKDKNPKKQPSTKSKIGFSINGRRKSFAGADICPRSNKSSTVPGSYALYLYYGKTANRHIYSEW